MENKYYTPEIEEFHVGFEYEIFRDESAYDYWDNTTENLDIHILLNKLNTGSIKVKYLDKEDIESLGWVLTKQKDGSWYELGKCIVGAEEMWHPLGNWKYRIFLNQNLPNWYHIDTRNPGNGGQLQIFRGTIKNKSELRKLMKQLNIV